MVAKAARLPRAASRTRARSGSARRGAWETSRAGRDTVDAAIPLNHRAPALATQRGRRRRERSPRPPRAAPRRPPGRTASGTADQLGPRFAVIECALVGPLGSHRVVGVAGGDDRGLDRDLGRPEAEGIAALVGALVVGQDPPGDV